MIQMDIRHNRPLAIAEIVVGVLLLAVSLLNSQVIGMAAGVILTLLGILMMVNPMLRIDQNEAQVRNPLGMTLKRFPVASPADLRLEGKTLHHVTQNKRIATLGLSAHSSDVDALRAQLANPGH